MAEGFEELMVEVDIVEVERLRGGRDPLPSLY
jgi:hypothetical protein